MTRNFRTDFPIKYVCNTLQLYRRGFQITADRTNCLADSGGITSFVPIGIHRAVNPLDAMIENRPRYDSLGMIAKDFGIEKSVIHAFHYSSVGRMNPKVIATYDEEFAYYLGLFFRANIFGIGTFTAVAGLIQLDTLCPTLDFKNFQFTAKGCSWFA